ncbi:MAG: adenylate/guanylate cyclase domain-containing protein [Gammaproteobacteria bacterium]|nr:adenylate/guanylate cyclase domain-containing protein [Gammaproteobacteria bacterium]
MLVGWLLAVPWLSRIPVPESWHPPLRFLEDLATPGLALAAGVPLIGVAAMAFMLMVGHLNVHGPRAALECLLAWLVLALAVVLLGPFPVTGSAAGTAGAAALMVVFALVAAALSHLQSMRLRAARAELARHAESQSALARRLARYLPPPVYRATFDDDRGTVAESRRRWLTVCFADLAGFTALTDSAESEEVVAMLDDFYTAMADAALEHGGTLDKFIGDAVMVFFGEHGSGGRHADARACVAMAADMQRRFTGLRRRWRATGVVGELDLRVGIHSGWCTVGDFGNAARMAYTVIGATVNAASRLEGAARPGQVLLSRSTWLLLGELAERCRRVGPVQAKGFQRSLEAFEFLGATAGEAALELETDGLRLSLAPTRVDPATARRLLEEATAALPGEAMPAVSAVADAPEPAAAGTPG